MHTEFNQVMGQLVGSFIQFLIGQLLIFKDKGDSIWRSLHLLLKKRVDGLWFAKVNGGVIPFMHNLMVFGISEHWQA